MRGSHYGESLESPLILQGMLYITIMQIPSKDLPSGSTFDGAKSHDAVVDETFCAWLVLTDSRGVLVGAGEYWRVGWELLEVGWLGELRLVGCTVFLWERAHIPSQNTFESMIFRLSRSVGYVIVPWRVVFFLQGLVSKMGPIFFGEGEDQS